MRRALTGPRQSARRTRALPSRNRVRTLRRRRRKWRFASPRSGVGSARTSAIAARSARSASAGSARARSTRRARSSRVCSGRSGTSSGSRRPRNAMPDDLNLSNLRPSEPRRARKRVGRGLGSGKGRYSCRGIKGQKSRSGSHKMRAGFEGGQMPIYMRLGKLRGPYSADAMPIGPHRTQTLPVNVRDLERFDDGTDVTIELLAEHGLIRNMRTDVKILGQGDLTKKLTVTAHRFSASAREKIESAGGTVVALREDKPRRRSAPKKPSEPQPEAEAEAPAAEEEE